MLVYNKEKENELDFCSRRGWFVEDIFNFGSLCHVKVDPLAMRNDDDIRTQQRKLEGVAAPLGEGSENSQLLQKLLYEKYTGTKHTTRGAGNF